MSSVQVFQEADGRWRWSYSDDKLDLKSNRTYGDADSAMRAARMAYPEEFDDPAPSPGSPRGLVPKIARFLTIVLLIIAWRRSKPHPD